MAYRETLVVVGNGMVGFKLCQQLVEARAHNRYHIVVFGEETRPAYDRVHLGDVLAGKPEGELSLAPASWYTEHGIDLHLGDPVDHIDRESRTVQSSKGEQLIYDWLVFATGSTSFVPEIEGRDLPGVFVARTLDDVDAILAYAQSAERVAVVGGGLLGLETARALRDLHFDVYVVEFAAGLMSRQLDQAASELLRSKVEALGVHILLERKIARIGEGDVKREVHFEEGEPLEVDMVIFAAGIVPRDQLARSCGVECAPKGGIQVDDRMQTSDAKIFAVGECASHQGVTYGLVAPGYRMAEVVASNLVDQKAEFAKVESSTRLKVAGLNVIAMGKTRIVGEAGRAFQKENVYRKLIIDDNKLVGAIAIGSWRSAARVQSALVGGRVLTTSQVDRFDATGSLWPRQSGHPVSRWPAKTLVCNCFNVTRGDLKEAFAGGCHTVEALARRTGASTGCGSCKALLGEFVGGEHSPKMEKEGKPLIGLAAVTIGLALFILGMHPLPVARTVASHLAALWSDRALKQVTGYGMVAPMALSLLLSVRKRVRRVKAGNYATWRIGHAVLGALTLGLLVLHTGLRLGHHINRWLMGDVLALAALGALAAAVTALDYRLPARHAQALRTLCNRSHIVLFWPLPVLVGFHVLLVYYF